MAALRVHLSLAGTTRSSNLRPYQLHSKLSTTAFSTPLSTAPSRTPLRSPLQSRPIPSTARHIHLSGILAQYRAPKSPRINRNRTAPRPDDIPYTPEPIEPEPQYQQQQGWDIGKITQRTFGVIFLSIFLGFNYEKIQGFFALGKEMRANPEKYENMSREERTRETKKAMEQLKVGEMTKRMHDLFTYSAAKTFPPEQETLVPHNVQSLVGYNFAHSSPMHLVFCYISLGVFLPDMARAFGATRAAGLFVIGGTLAGFIHTYFERLTNPFATLTAQKENQPNMEPDAIKRYARDYYVPGLGSSSAIISLATLTCFINPALEVSMMFIPIGIPIRVMMGGLAAFDGYGYFIKDWGMGLGHGGHLAGYASGVILWALFFRGRGSSLAIRRLRAMSM